MLCGGGRARLDLIQWDRPVNRLFHSEIARSSLAARFTASGGTVPPPGAAPPAAGRPPGRRAPPPGAPLPDHQHEFPPGGLVPVSLRRRPQGGADHLLVELGQFPAQGDGPVGAQGVRQIPEGGGQLVGGLVEDQGPLLPRSCSSRARRFFLFMGRKPSKVNRPVGWPETARAVTRAQGPGMDTTGMSSWTHRATSSSPGSETAGCPRR